MKNENPNRDEVAAGAEAVENVQHSIDTAKSAQLQADVSDDKPRLLIDNTNPNLTVDGSPRYPGRGQAACLIEVDRFVLPTIR